LKLSFDNEIKNYKLEFDFGREQSDDMGAAIDFSALRPIGICPKCKGRVFEQSMSYVCENTVAQPKGCDFRSGKVILQQEIGREQMQKLLCEGRTDLLTGFRSSRTGRHFKAFLVQQKEKDSAIGFEFEKKAAASPPKRAARKTSVKKISAAE